MHGVDPRIWNRIRAPVHGDDVVQREYQVALPAYNRITCTEEADEQDNNERKVNYRNNINTISL